MIIKDKNKLIYIFCMLFIINVSRPVHADIPYVKGVDYLPEHYNQYYNGENTNLRISDDDIENDFFVMSQNFDAVRTYQYDNINLQRILRTAKRYKMKVVLGIGINTLDNVYTNEQISGVNQMFEQYPDLLDSVIAIAVGNAVIRNHTNPTKEVNFLVEKFNTVKDFPWLQNSKINLCVSERETIFADDAGKMLLKKLPKSTPILININPYMSGCSVTAAVGDADGTCESDSFQDKWKRLVNNPELKTHQIIVGETGWPTEGQGVLSPVRTQRGNLLDAIQYFEFLYKFLSKQKINNQSISIPFFIFSAFDEPMMGVFGFSSNFWGVYNFDSTPKIGMVYPLNRSIMPTPKIGTNIKINLPEDSYYNNAKTPILFKTNDNEYSNKPNIIYLKTKKSSGKNNTVRIFSFLNNYPYVKYSSSGSNVVSLILPNGGDSSHRAATCTNELISGNGHGIKSSFSLNWKYPHSKEKYCEYINWAENGIWIN